jgi:hypothetical protein
MSGWFLGVCGAWSQFWNAVWGGDRDQSFSSRSWEAKLLGRFGASLMVVLIDLLFFFEKNHCQRAYESDTERSYSAPDQNNNPI